MSPLRSSQLRSLCVCVCVCFLRPNIHIPPPLEYCIRIVATITNQNRIVRIEIRLKVNIYDTNRWMAGYHRVRSASTANVSTVPTNKLLQMALSTCFRCNSNNAAILQLLTWHPRLVFSVFKFNFVVRRTRLDRSAHSAPLFTTWKQRLRTKSKPTVLLFQRNSIHTLPVILSRKENTLYVCDLSRTSLRYATRINCHVAARLCSILQAQFIFT